MAKEHKHAGDGVDIDTLLSIEQVANIAQSAAQESTGDLIKGKQRVVTTRSADRQIEFRINDYLISFNKLMVFYLEFEEHAGFTRASTRIGWYMRNQQTVAGFIPVSPRRMVAHHTYLQFANQLAAKVRAADPTARVALRDGSAAMPPQASEVPAVHAEPQTQRGPAASGDIPPPPPPPPPSAVSPEPVPVAWQAAPVPPAAKRIPARPSAPPPVPVRPPAAAPMHPVPPGLLAAGLVTAVPGFPRPPAAPTSPLASGASPVPLPLTGAGFFEAEDAEVTRRAAGGVISRWELSLPDGTTVAIDRAAVVGRNPTSTASAPQAIPVLLADHTQSVSKTHAALEVREGMVWVTDLHSTNGTLLTNPAGEEQESPAGQPMPVGDGWQVAFGDFVVLVQGR